MPIADPVAAIQAWLDTAPNSERTGDFRAIRPERMRAFLGHVPAPPAPCTVAGTKGKGSTVHLIEAALLGNGHRTVAFTSPHVLSVMERWRVDGRPADPAAVATLCPGIEAIEDRTGLRLSWFERTFAIACLLAHQHGGAFLCEVGLGGRLDATNALDAAVAVLTHISHDHRDVLGPTVWHIAREKLAIARPGHPLVIAPQDPATALAVWHRQPRAEVRWAARPIQAFTLAMDGAHQQDNAATALLAATLYRPGLDPARARHAMAQATLAARCQLIHRGGRQLLIDGAHNGPSLAATMAVAARRLRAGWTLILGVAQDKEIDEMLAVVPAERQVVRCGYDSPRARGADAWPVRICQTPWFSDVRKAISGTSGDLCISGSIYLAGEALRTCDADGGSPG